MPNGQARRAIWPLLMRSRSEPFEHLEILAYYYAPWPKCYFNENPWTGMLKRREVMQEYNAIIDFVMAAKVAVTKKRAYGPICRGLASLQAMNQGQRDIAAHLPASIGT